MISYSLIYLTIFCNIFATIILFPKNKVLNLFCLIIYIITFYHLFFRDQFREVILQNYIEMMSISMIFTYYYLFKNTFISKINDRFILIIILSFYIFLTLINYFFLNLQFQNIFLTNFFFFTTLKKFLVYLSIFYLMSEYKDKKYFILYLNMLLIIILFISFNKWSILFFTPYLLLLTKIRLKFSYLVLLIFVALGIYYLFIINYDWFVTRMVVMDHETNQITRIRDGQRLIIWGDELKAYLNGNILFGIDPIKIQNSINLNVSNHNIFIFYLTRFGLIGLILILFYLSNIYKFLKQLNFEIFLFWNCILVVQNVNGTGVNFFSIFVISYFLSKIAYRYNIK